MSFQCFSSFYLKIIVLYLLLFDQFGKKAFAREKKCGQALTKALALFCVNRFNSRLKRSPAQQNENRNVSEFDESWYSRLKEMLKKFEPEPNENKPHDYETAHLIIKEDKILIRKRKQVYVVTTKGVADECCIRACAYDEIIQYCA